MVEEEEIKLSGWLKNNRNQLFLFRGQLIASVIVGETWSTQQHNAIVCRPFINIQFTGYCYSTPPPPPPGPMMIIDS